MLQLSFTLVAALALLAAILIKVVVYLLTSEDLGLPRQSRSRRRRRTRRNSVRRGTSRNRRRR
ncbi:hypothetical protein AGRA3207_007538 [Actinomadura graeca]|uniref:Uncharacterized protein n=1 Tax=Actinomadura graeca TaxID=2750812 RepID=A0ABX8R4I5_9ACTN|nr:hypothetical protein [Actinomadura graeca]QXJ25967.1 hypothetical protein AGRA3207_007538 [Actinomadura graeca]